MSSKTIRENLSKQDTEIVGAMMHCMYSVARFVHADEVMPKQSVGDHVDSICERVNKSVKNKDLAEYLRISAIFHDLGEIIGEFEMKNPDDEPMIANYFFYVFSKYSHRRAVEEVNRLRMELKNGFYEKEDNHTITDLFEERDENETAHLYEVYKEVTSKETDEQKLFDLLDKLDGLSYYVNNRDLSVETKHSLEEWRSLYQSKLDWFESSPYKEKEPKLYYDVKKEMTECLKKLK